MRYLVHFSQWSITRFQPDHQHSLSLFLRMDSDKVLALIQWNCEHVFIWRDYIILNIEQIIIEQSSVHILNIKFYISDLSDISFHYVVRIFNKQCFYWCDNDIQIVVVRWVCSFVKFDAYQAFIFSWDQFIIFTNSDQILIWLWDFSNGNSLIFQLITWVWWYK